MEPQLFAMLVSEEAVMLRRLEVALHQQGVRTSCARDRADARRILSSEQAPNLIFTAASFRDGTWRDVVAMAKRTEPPRPVILVTRLDEISLYLEAMNEGACDYIVPPFGAADVAHIIRSSVQDCVAERGSLVSVAGAD